MRMLRILFWTVIFVGASALADEKAKEFKPTEIQLARLKLRQDDANAAFKDMQLAQQLYQQSLNRFDAEAGAVVKENKWPTNLTYDRGTLQFSLPAPPPDKKP